MKKSMKSKIKTNIVVERKNSNDDIPDIRRTLNVFFSFSSETRLAVTTIGAKMKCIPAKILIKNDPCTSVIDCVITYPIIGKIRNRINT